MRSRGAAACSVIWCARRAWPASGRLASTSSIATRIERGRGDLLEGGTISGEERPGGSSWQSLARRAGTIETDYLNGEIVLLGRPHGVATPVNELLVRVTSEAARSGAHSGTFTEDELFARLPS